METTNDKIDQLSDEVASLTADASPESLASFLDRVRFHEDRLKAIRKTLESICFDHIQATNKPIMVGPMMYAIAREKKTKVINAAKTMDLILTLSGGDVDQAAESFLGSTPFKYGAIKKAIASAGMPESVYQEHFKEWYEDKLEKTGEKKLKQINTDFLPR